MVIETRNPKNDDDEVVCMDAHQLVSRLDEVPRKPLGKVFWERPGPLPCNVQAVKQWEWDLKRNICGLILSTNAVVVLSETPWKVRVPAPADRSWSVVALSRTDGRLLWEVKLPGEPIINGLCLDRDGRVIVALTDGGLVGIGSH